MFSFFSRCVVVGLMMSALTVHAKDEKRSTPFPQHNWRSETKEQHDQRMAWWREARFGMFIHWGIYSVHGDVWNGKRYKSNSVWLPRTLNISVEDYAKLADKFNPVKFDAEAWVSLADEAGMKYLIYNTKQHDGFAMFGTKVSPFNIVNATPFDRDPLKEVAAACQRHGIKLGYHYSQAQDWHHPGGAAAGGRWDKAQEGDMTEYIKKIAVPQVRELLTNYGPVAVMWWDTPVDMTPERAELLLPLMNLQPGIIMNNRLGGGYGGDFATPEQEIPATGLDRDWETCMTISDDWGYHHTTDAKDWKSTKTLLHMLVDTVSKGGNFLLNVGPDPEGVIPPNNVARLKEIGRWMKVNGESIYGTTASPFPKLDWGRATQKPGTLFLHVFDWPKGELIVPGLKNKVAKAYLLSDPQRSPLATTARPDGVAVQLPADAPDENVSVVVLEIEGKPDVDASGNQ